MFPPTSPRCGDLVARPAQRTAFTLVELLTVVFIISLLIGILLPSLNNARTQAKNVAIKGQISAIEKALEQFKTDNEKEFRSTNGYPPSYWDAPGNQPDPFLNGEDETEPQAQKLYGAQWLVRYLLGKDSKGFVPKRNVPSNLANQVTPYAQKNWYWPSGSGDDASAPTGVPIDRNGPYLDSASLPLKKLKELTGQPPSSMTLGLQDIVTNDGNLTGKQPVIVDKFEYPILYYVANPLGRAMSTPATTTVLNSIPTPPIAETGIYRQSDNAGFTGYYDGTYLAGWNFGGGGHPIGHYMNNMTDTVAATDGLDLDDATRADTFVGYIHDENVHVSGGINPANAQTIAGFRHQPYNKDRFLLISAGKDGRYGTKDDVKNFGN